MVRLLKLKNQVQDNTKMGDHLGFKHFTYFQFGCDWQKYYANQANLPNFTNQLQFRKNSITQLAMYVSADMTS